jgi:hypothetical protein
LVKWCVAAVLSISAGAAMAQDAPDAPMFAKDPALDSFIYSNVVSVFYHEFGHALIDVLLLPVLGREEDAADTLSSLLIDQLWEEESSIKLIYDTTLAYQLYEADMDGQADLNVFADVHGMNLQRYFNYVCLYAGANLEGRDDIALELGLPEERLITCEDEHELAAQSWEALLQNVPVGDGSQESLVLVNAGPDPALAWALEQEIAVLNQEFVLPQQIAVSIEPCGEANAFYASDLKAIIFCTEFVEEWERLYQTHMQ